MLILSKTQLMERVAQGLGRESFEHSLEGLFDITAMRQKAVAEKVEIVAVVLDTLPAHLRETRDFDEARVRYFKDRFLRATRIEDLDPGIVVTYDAKEGEQPSTLLIDGTHRIIAASELGSPKYPCYMMHESQIVRPGRDWMRNPFVGWGEKEIVDGKLVKR